MTAAPSEDEFELPSADDWAAVATFRPAREAVKLVADLNVAALSATGRVDALIALRRAERWVAAQTQRLVADHVAASGELADVADRTGRQWSREDVAVALDIDPDVARGVVAEAEALTQVFPSTLWLLEQGEISPRHASALVAATAQLDPAAAAKVETQVIGRAASQSVPNFKRSLARAVHRVDPRTAAEKHTQARAERRMWIQPDPDGMAMLGAVLPAEDAAVIQAAVDAFTDRVRATHPTDPRSAAQLRADALTHFATGYLNGTNRGGSKRRPAVHVTVALETLLGLNDQPAELDGYGPITAATARAIAADPTGTWHRLITDPAGKLLDYQQTRYKPPKDLDEHVRARDRRCRFPQCRRRAQRCDLDHTHDYHHGGHTCPMNLACLCPRHHALKHDTGWQLTGNPEHTLTWTTPTGHTHTTTPPPQPATTPPPSHNDDPPPF